MIVSHKHKFIFLKTRKTASTTTELVLYPHCGEDDIITPLSVSEHTGAARHRARNHIRPAFPRDPRPAIARKHPLEGFKTVDFHDHIRAGQVRAYVGEKVWRSYYKFAFDRNVYDRQVSWYHYKTAKRWKSWLWPDFNTFLLRSPEAKVDNFLIYTIDRVLAVDFIGRYETLAEDLAIVLKTLGLPRPRALPKAKVGPRPEAVDYRHYYDEDLRRLVESWYPGELAMFGNEF